MRRSCARWSDCCTGSDGVALKIDGKDDTDLFVLQPGRQTDGCGRRGAGRPDRVCPRAGRRRRTDDPGGRVAAAKGPRSLHALDSRFRRRNLAGRFPKGTMTGGVAKGSRFRRQRTGRGRRVFPKRARQDGQELTDHGRGQRRCRLLRWGSAIEFGGRREGESEWPADLSDGQRYCDD